MENAGRMRQYYLNFVKHDIEKIIETKVYKNKKGEAYKKQLEKLKRLEGIKIKLENLTLSDEINCN